jgi:NifU-like protein involved in Fe-S cluster formation
MDDVAMQQYSARVAEYFHRPVRNMGGEVRGEAGSVEQGTLICLAADVREGKLLHVGFRVFACPHIIAACNWQADLLQGAPVDALQEVDLAELQLMFDIPVEKAGKLLILKDALAACREHYEAGSASL